MTGKQKIKKILGLCFLCISVAGVVVLTSFNSMRQKKQICSDILISIDHSNDIYFIDENEVTEILVHEFGDTLNNEMIQSIDLKVLENAIELNPFVEEAETFLDAEGKLHIQVNQKEPIARIINKYGVNYYITKNAYKFPVNNKFTCRVPIINGNIEEDMQNLQSINTKSAQEAFKIIEFIRDDALWNAQIEQIYLNDKNEFECIPKVGNYIIVIGDAENLEIKFSNLEIFYSQGLNYVGWDKYEKINVSITNQIICTKKDTLSI